MRNLFSMDSKLMRALGLVADYAILNVIYIVTCIPLITIGAAKTALYRVMFDMLEGNADSYLKRYFKTFAREFKTATPLFLFKDGVLALICWSLWIATHNDLPLKAVSVIGLVVVLALWSVVFANLFVQVALFESKFGEYLKNCLFIALNHPLKSILVAVMELIPPLLFLGAPDLLGALGPVWLFFWFSVTCNLAARIWKKPFDGYIEKATEEDAPEALPEDTSEE